MGILEGMVAGAGEALQNVGLQGVAAAIQAERDARLSELRLSEEATIRQRGKDDAAAERARVETEAKRNAEQRGGLIAERQGLDDPEYRGDENPGYNVQKGQAAPTSRDYMKAQGKYTEIANLEEKDADNLRDAARRKSEDEKWRTQFAETVRHNTALESSANYGRIPPAAKAQLEMASTAVMSAHKAEAEAAKALEAGRKDTLASPEKIRQLEDEYKSSKAAVVSALKQYDQIGAAHFGEQWKKTEIEAPATSAGGTVTYVKDASGKLVRQGGDSKPATAPASNKDVMNERPTPVQQSDYTAAETAAADRKARLDKERDERMEKQRKRGEEIDEFNARMKQK